MLNIAIGGVDHDEQWAPVSDLMAALMLIFMFIAIVYIRTVVLEKDLSNEKCSEIYYVLKDKFSDDFKKWDADLDNDLTIRFRNPKILFSSGEAGITEEFRDILIVFFPRYIESLRGTKQDIQEIRIEGHTSSKYEGAKTKDDAYIKNMELSQDRAREILQYVLEISGWDNHKNWAVPKITANGLSSSKLRYIRDSDGNKKEDADASRRVEFRVLASSCQKAGRYAEQGESDVF